MKANTKKEIISTLVKRFLATIILGIGLSASASAQMFCQAAFTYTVGSNGTINCTNTSTGGGPNTLYTWQWQGVSGFGYTYTSSPTISFGYNGAYWLSLSMNDSLSNCYSGVTDTIVITNGQPCQASFTYALGTNGQVSFTNNSVGSTNYEWSFGDGTYSSVSAPTHTYMYNGSYVVYVYGDTTGAHCGAYAMDTIVTTTGLTCNTVANFTYTSGTNGLINFSNTSTGTNANTTYTWDFGDYNSSNLQSPSNTYLYNGMYRIRLTVSDSSGLCSSIYNDSITINNAAPTPTCNASFTYSSGSNGQVSFTNTTTGTMPHTRYSWDFGDGNQYYDVMSPTYTYSYNGTYTVFMLEYDSLNNNYSCSTSQVITITNTINNPNGCTDSVYFYMYPDSSSAHTWNIYLVSGFNGSYPVNATWNWGDGTSSNGLSSHTYASAGWYTICVSAFFACGDSSYYCQNDSVYRSSSSMITMHVFNASNTTGIKNVSNEVNSVKVFPNPFADNLTINLNSINNSTINYSISDMYGNIIMKEKVGVDKGENKITLNTSGLSNGMYFVNVVDSNSKKMHTLKIVK